MGAYVKKNKQITTKRNTRALYVSHLNLTHGVMSNFRINVRFNVDLDVKVSLVQNDKYYKVLLSSSC